MSDNKKFSKKDELDSFWDIERIVPKRKNNVSSSPKNTDTVEISVSSVLENISDGGTFKSSKLSYGETYSANHNENLAPKPSFEYCPRNSLIHNVRIYKRTSQYKYYEDFYKQALSLLERDCVSAEFTPYFSYVPQYDQLSQKQLDYYLFFRANARKGTFIEADMSYILLYAYELINLGDTIDTNKSQSMLYELWREYGKKYPKLNKQLIEWLCDYSLIHKLQPPKDADIQAIAEVSTLKEFFAVLHGNDFTSYANLLLSFSSSYDYRKSKFATGDALELFEKHVPIALGLCVKHLSTNGILSGLGFCDCTLPRDAYSGALCTHRAKMKIEVDFCSFSRTNELRYVIGEIVKYAENKIRGYIGVKSRLTVYMLDNDIKAVLDAYFARVLIRTRRAVREPKREEYDALYDLPKTALSLSEAKHIEEESWETTKKLVEAFEDGVAEADDTNSFVEALSEPLVTENNEADGIESVLGNLYPYALAVFNEDKSAQQKESAALCKMPDSIVDSINELFSDYMGDILIEDDGEERKIVEDYRYLFE